MNYLTLNTIKQHLNIDKNFHDDDDYLLALGDMAEEIVSRHIDYKLCDLEEDGNIPAPILHACKLMVGNMYMNRESVSSNSNIEIPLSYQYLLATYKNRSRFNS